VNHQMPPERADHLRWTVRNPGQGEKLKGWVFGERFGCCTHHISVTKPCRAKLTSNVLACPYCQTGMGMSWTGYLPWIDPDGEKCVAMYSSAMEATVSALSLGQPIVLLKGKYQAARVIVRQDSWSGAPCPFLGRLKLTPDIRPFLRLIWKDEELKLHFGMKPEPLPLPESMQRPVVSIEDRKADMTEASKMLRSRIDKTKGKEESVSTEELFDRKKPSNNGKH
jgi:hypothetical protein